MPTLCPSVKIQIWHVKLQLQSAKHDLYADMHSCTLLMDINCQLLTARMCTANCISNTRQLNTYAYRPLATCGLCISTPEALICSCSLLKLIEPQKVVSQIPHEGRLLHEGDVALELAQPTVLLLTQRRVLLTRISPCHPPHQHVSDSSCMDPSHSVQLGSRQMTRH